MPVAKKSGLPTARRAAISFISSASFACSWPKLRPIRLYAQAIDLSRHALDDAPMVLEQKLELRRVGHADEPVAVERLGRVFGGLRKIDRRPSPARRPQAATGAQSNKALLQSRRRAFATPPSG